MTVYIKTKTNEHWINKVKEVHYILNSRSCTVDDEFYRNIVILEVVSGEHIWTPIGGDEE